MELSVNYAGVKKVFSGICLSTTEAKRIIHTPAGTEDCNINVIKYSPKKDAGVSPPTL